MKRERMTNPKCLGGTIPDTFSARSADLTGLKMRRITRAVSFDHLVGAGEQRNWDLQPERLGGLEIDHQLVLGRSLNRQIGRLFALSGYDRYTPLRVDKRPGRRCRRKQARRSWRCSGKRRWSAGDDELPALRSADYGCR